ncbi:hypothetical protein, partial [Xylella fastidiosa]|uniref:hypothetical protein n=1 Tax=Xylella fastidiosa TaxID=2371 RepID=UPI00235FF0B0
MKTFSKYTPALNHLALALASTLLLIATYTANATFANFMSLMRQSRRCRDNRHAVRIHSFI